MGVNTVDPNNQYGPASVKIRGASKNRQSPTLAVRYGWPGLVEIALIYTME